MIKKKQQKEKNVKYLKVYEEDNNEEIRNIYIVIIISWYRHIYYLKILDKKRGGETKIEVQDLIDYKK